MTSYLLPAALLLLLLVDRLQSATGDATLCAARGERAVECGSGNPSRPDLCCAGLQCSAWSARCWLPEDTDALGNEETNDITGTDAGEDLTNKMDRNENVKTTETDSDEDVVNVTGEESTETDNGTARQPQPSDSSTSATTLEKLLDEDNFGVSYRAGFALFVFIPVIVFAIFGIVSAYLFDAKDVPRFGLFILGLMLRCGTSLFTWGEVIRVLDSAESLESSSDHISIVGLIVGSILTVVGGPFYALYTYFVWKRDNKKGAYTGTYVFATFILLLPGLLMLAMYCRNMENVSIYEYYGPMRITGWKTRLEGMYPPREIAGEMNDNWKEYAYVDVSWGMWWGCPGFDDNARWCTYTLRDYDCTYCTSYKWRDRLRGFCKSGSPNAADCMTRKYGTQENFVGSRRRDFDPQAHPEEDPTWPSMIAYGDCDSCTSERPVMLESIIHRIPTVKAVGGCFVIAGAAVYVL